MENASKAILIAGGILMAVIIMSVLVYSFGSMNGYFNEEQIGEKAEQLTAFNQQYESYHRKLLRGADVVSILNKVVDHNKKYVDVANYEIKAEFQMKESAVYQKDDGGKNQKLDKVIFKVGQVYDQNTISEIKQSKEAFDDFKRRIFDCTEIKYNQQTGRVNYIKFVERKLDNYAEDY